MKKIIVLLSCLLLLVGCGGKEENKKEIIIENKESSAFNSVFYYDLITDEQKAYYDLFLESSLNNENSIKGNFALNEDDYFIALKAFTYDYPNYYWWAKGISASYSSKSFEATSIESKENIVTNIELLNNKKNEILSNCRNENNYIIIKNIHDYLVNNIVYDSNADNSHNILGSLLQGESVCDGYALAFKYLCNEAGFNCNVIEGTAFNSKNQMEEHAWNEVELNGEWYLVDTTWDNQYDEETGKNVAVYHYFLINDEMMNSDHYPIEDYKYHNHNNSSLFYLNMPGKYIPTYNEDEISSFINDMLKQDYKDLYIKFSNYDDGLKAHTYLLENGEFLRIFEKINANFNIEFGGEYGINSHILHIYYDSIDD